MIRLDTAYAEWQGARAGGSRDAGLGARRTTAAWLRPRRRQPDRLRLAAARRHRPDARHLARGAAARRARRVGRVRAGRQPRHAGGRAATCEVRRLEWQRIALAADDRQLQLARRPAARRMTASGRRRHARAWGQWLFRRPRWARSTATPTRSAWSGGQRPWATARGSTGRAGGTSRDGTQLLGVDTLLARSPCRRIPTAGRSRSWSR